LTGILEEPIGLEALMLLGLDDDAFLVGPAAFASSSRLSIEIGSCRSAYVVGDPMGQIVAAVWGR